MIASTVRATIALCLGLGLASCAARSAGPEVQAYPAGVIAGMHFQYPLGDQDSLTWRFAANITERGDFGEHDDESGSGFGGGIGWRRLLADQGPGDGWVLGARMDFWQLDVDWEDRNPTARGNTETLVVQPTLEAGVQLPMNDKWSVQLMAALGVEINTGVDGEDIGEGAIFLLGATFLRRFN